MISPQNSVLSAAGAVDRQALYAYDKVSYKDFDFPDKEGEHMDESLLRKTG